MGSRMLTTDLPAGPPRSRTRAFLQSCREPNERYTSSAIRSFLATLRINTRDLPQDGPPPSRNKDHRRLAGQDVKAPACLQRQVFYFVFTGVVRGDLQPSLSDEVRKRGRSDSRNGGFFTFCQVRQRRDAELCEVFRLGGRDPATKYRLSLERHSASHLAL